MRPRKYQDTGMIEVRPVIPVRNSKTPSCAAPMCTACLLAKQKLRATGSKAVQDRESSVLSREHLEPGDCVSVDQYISGTKGRLATSKGKEKDTFKFQGGMLAVDHASGAIFIKHQVSLRGGETLQAKRSFEQWARDAGVKIKAYHTDNGIFAGHDWKEDCALHEQELSFSGVGAKHQNGVAERAIGTCVTWARAMIIHSVIHWPEETPLDLWPFAFEHAVHIWNHLPRKETGMAPIEIFTGSKIPEDREPLKRSHVWGCPAYVLNPQLQDGKKIPKWVVRSRRGQFVGVSPEHSTSIGRIRGLDSGHISPQFHIVYDDHFSTVSGATAAQLNDANLRTSIDGLVHRFGGEIENDTPIEFNERGHVEPAPQLDLEWITDDEIRYSQQRERRRHGNRLPINLEPYGPTVDQFFDVDPVDDDAQSDEFTLTPEYLSDSDTHPDDDPDILASHDRPRRAVARDPSSPLSRTEGAVSPPEGERRMLRRRPKLNTKYYNDQEATSWTPASRILTNRLNTAFIAKLDWTKSVASIKSRDARFLLARLDDATDPDTGLVDSDYHPMLLAAKMSTEDTPNWNEATGGENSMGYWEAMQVEYDVLIEKQAWIEVDRTPEMNVLPSTWAFKCKRFPDGAVKKLKARFCVMGNRQIDGVDVFDTYAPVVSWTTVRLLLILTCVLGLATTQVDYTAAFVQAKIDEDVYVAMPRGKIKPGKVLKLQRSLYGLKQSPKNFFDHLKERLEYCGFEQSNSDPCLFVKPNCICLTYVDDCLFFAPHQEDIDATLERLKGADLDFNVESDVAGFLGVLLTELDDGKIELTQTGLTDRIITSMGLDDANPKESPAEYGALPADREGDPCNEGFNYPSVVGMLIYLASNSRPDIAFAVHQCARFTHHPRLIHEQALKRIGRYLVGTKTKGLILDPKRNDLGIDLYVDADFAGLWSYEDPQDPSCVKSRTGFVIQIAGCPVMWASRLQQEIALSTMQAEYTATLETDMTVITCI